MATIAPAPPRPPGAPLELPGRRTNWPRLGALGVLLILVGLAGYSISHLLFDGASWRGAAANASRFLDQAIPLDFPPAGQLVKSSLQTLGLVILGTVLASLLSLPIAYMAASNTTPNAVVRLIGRGLGIVARAVPDAILALIFATMFTFGALPGILAIGLHSIGMISKLYADAIEQIDDGPRVAIRAAGGGRGQEFFAGVLPQVMPSFVATSLHRNDINLRGVVILGYVGVAGLGHDLSFALQTLDYQRAMALAVVIFALCVLMEIVSSGVRARLLGVAPTGRSIGKRLARRYSRAGSPAEEARRSGTAHTLTVEQAAKRPWTRRRATSVGLGWGAVAVIIASVVVCDIKWSDFVNVWSKVPRTWDRLWPPGLHDYPWSEIRDAMIETIGIALAATVLSLVFSLVIGPLAARHVAPNGVVRAISRLLLLIIRGIPELILALVLITILGLGDAPAIVALAFGGIGLLGKLIADSMEEVPQGPATAVTAAGATRGQKFMATTIPLSAPAIVGHSFYLLDTNIRAASILGIVGSGGIGYYLLNSARIAHYHDVFAMLLVIMATVFVTELIAMWIRKVVK